MLTIYPLVNDEEKTEDDMIIFACAIRHYVVEDLYLKPHQIPSISGSTFQNLCHSKVFDFPPIGGRIT
jgi:hypothetical protein